MAWIQRPVEMQKTDLSAFLAFQRNLKSGRKHFIFLDFFASFFYQENRSRRRAQFYLEKWILKIKKEVAEGKDFKMDLSL